MKLLLLNHNLREQGTYFRAFHFGRELARMGHEVTLVTTSPNHWYRPAREQGGDIEIIESPSWSPWSGPDDGFGPLDVAYRSALVLRRRWDALFAFAHPPNVFFPHWVYRLARRGRVAVDWCDCYAGSGGVVARRRREYSAYPSHRPRSALRRLAIHATWRVEPWFEYRMMKRAPRLTVISRFLERRALRLGVPSERLLHLPSGAPVDAIHTMEKAACRTRLGIPEGDDRAVIVYVANYHHDEDFILRSLRYAAQASERPSGSKPLAQETRSALALDSQSLPWTLYVVGPRFREGRVEEFGLTGVVRVMGRRPFSEIAEWLGAADLLLLPYPDSVFNRSRWPNKIGDYLAAGRPTITNRTGDFIPLFQENDIGVAADSTPEAFARAIAEAVAARHRWEDWGAAARRLAEGPFAWPALAAQLADFWLG